MVSGTLKGQVATVTSRSMVTIPSKIRKKYGLKQGSKIGFIEIEGWASARAAQKLAGAQRRGEGKPASAVSGSQRARKGT